jgi:potassium-dependent mechanosensitive channel
LIYAVGILVGIHVERINLNTPLLLGGTLGVGVGFGLQSLVSNVVAGIILHFARGAADPAGGPDRVWG